jgi:hypothetical protein
MAGAGPAVHGVLLRPRGADRVADQAATGATSADGAHPQGGPPAEPERSERLARRPAGADTAAEASHTGRRTNAKDTRRAKTHRGSSPPPYPDRTQNRDPPLRAVPGALACAQPAAPRRRR